MSWKYIMLQVGDRAMPIIFPSEFVHAHVAGAMQQVVGAIKGPDQQFHERQLEARLQDAKYREEGAPPISAGFLEGMVCVIAGGESKSLKIKADPKDTNIINSHPYSHGLETGINAEPMVLLKTTELLIKRLEEIGH